jgi:hypothetical protein
MLGKEWVFPPTPFFGIEQATHFFGEIIARGSCLRTTDEGKGMFFRCH